VLGPTRADRLVADLLEDPSAALPRHAAAIPELAALSSCPQPRNHHAEGDVAAHTQLAMEALADLDAQVQRFAGDALDHAGLTPLNLPHRTLTTAVAVFLHDVGKPLTIAGDEGRWTYYGHEAVGAQAAVRLIQRLDLVGAAQRAGADLDVTAVEWLIREHLFWLNTNVHTVTFRAVARRYVDDPVRGDMLRVVNWCDTLGSRGPDGHPHIDLLVAAEQCIAAARERAAEIAAAPRPLLNGRAIMELVGIQPGPRVGAILRMVRQRWQREADATQWLREHADRLREAPLLDLERT
jgi:hypothetical protein